MKKYYIFGDSSGWFTPLSRSLQGIGVDFSTMLIPKDVEIVHLGDLVHKGKDSQKLVSLVHMLMTVNNANPEQGNWIQIIGNHESNYFDEAPVFWDYELSSKYAFLLRHWKDSGLLKLAHVLDTTEGKPFVLSHAGLSKDFFRSFNGKSLSSMADIKNPIISQVVANMNNGFIKDMKNYSRPGEMLGAHIASHVSPFWANTVKEVIPTWGDNQPFHQIVGHITPFLWDKKRFFMGTPKRFLFERYFSITEKESIAVFHYLNGSEILFLDPGYTSNESLLPEKQPFLTINSKGEIETKLSKWKGHKLKRAKS